MSLPADIMYTSSTRQCNTVIKDGLMSKMVVAALVAAGHIRSMALFVNGLLEKSLSRIDELVIAGGVRNGINTRLKAPHSLLQEV